MTELLTYFEPVISVRLRKEIITSNFDNSHRYIYPMKICEQSDFKTRGYIFDENFASTVKYRLCPNITEENKDHYVIKNLFTNLVER